MSQLSKEDVQEIAKEFSSILAPSLAALDKKVDDLTKVIESYKVEPEIHYLDHLLIQDCRKKNPERSKNHQLLLELVEKHDLVGSVKFANKIHKREIMIKSAAFRGTVAIGLGCAANWVASLFGKSVDIQAVITWFK